MPPPLDVHAWLHEQCAEFVFRPAGVYVEQGDHPWPLVAENPQDLTMKLDGARQMLKHSVQ